MLGARLASQQQQQQQLQQPLQDGADEPYLASPGSPAHLRFRELARVAGVSRAFTLAVKLGLPSLLAGGGEAGVPSGGGLTAAQIGAALRLRCEPLRPLRDWLDLLASIEVLQRTGEGEGARYANSPDASRYLDQGSAEYMGGHAILYHDRTFPQLLWLEDSLRSGSQPPLAAQLVAPVLATFHGTAKDGGSSGPSGGSPAAFALGMSGCNKAAFEALAARFDFSPYSRLVDVGGSAGVLSCCVAAGHPHMTCTSLDLPAVRQAAEAYIQARGLQDRVQAGDMDFLTDPFPPADVVCMSMVLHDWGIATKQALIRKAYEALRPGGALVVVETLIDDARRDNLWGLAMSLDMLCEFGQEGAGDYSLADFAGWAAAAGFSGGARQLRLVGPNSAAIAIK